jgi:hypothetical protein
VVNSGCTNHMIREKKIFTSFEKNDTTSDSITFRDNSQGNVLGHGNIAITTEHFISKVLLVEYLDYNCLFTNKGVTIFSRSDGSFAFKGVLRGKHYFVDFVPEEVELDKRLIPKRNMGWLWHHRLAHAGMRNLYKLQKHCHIIGLTNIVFEKDRPCGACQPKKKVGAPHHTKNIMTTIRPLEMLHMDLFGPTLALAVTNMVL